MSRRAAGLLAVFLLLFVSAGICLAAEGSSLVLTGSPLPFPTVTRPIFPTNVSQIEAAVTLPGREKARVEFVWISPDGSTYSDTAKIFYPPAGAGPTMGRDVLKVAGGQPSKSPGWWTVEAVFADRKLSARFLLTNNRQFLAIAHGSTAQKISALGSIDLGAEGSEEALGIACGDDEVKVRAAAVKAMSVPAPAWASGLLEKLQDDPVPTVRVGALKALLAAGGDAAPRAAEKARTDGARNVRKALVEGLAGSDAAWSTAMLGRLLKDKDFEVRAAALGVLAGRTGPEAVKALSEGREVDDVQFRKDLLGILVARSEPARSETLQPWLRDPDPGIRLMALKEVAAAGGPEALGAIRPLVADPSETVAEAALDALYGSGDAPGVALAFEGGKARLRKKAVSLLVGMKGPDAVTGLLRAMKDEDADIRRTAMGGLVQVGGAGVPGLLAALKDSDVEIRHGAVTALAALGTADADKGMAEALGDREPSIREKAAGYFIHKGGPGLASVLGGLACDVSAPVRSMGLASLVVMQGEDSSRALSAYYSCGDLPTRETVVDVLSNRADPAARECLTAALKDKEAGVRLKAAAALLAAGVKAPLTALADDTDPGVRRVALTAMSEAPSPGMLPVLKKLAADPDEGVRLLSLDVLNRIPGDESGSVISLAVSDSSGSVRQAARGIVLSRRDAGVVEGLYGIAVSEEGPSGRKALDALAGIPGGKADEAISGVFRKGPAGLRTAALEELSRRGAAGFYDAEKEAAGGADAGLGLAALDMAGRLPGSQAEEVYLSAMSSRALEVREAAIRHISAQGGAQARQALLGALDDADPAVRRSALAALARLKDPSLSGRLPKLVRDPDQATRAAALAEAMRLEGPEKAVALVAAADGPYQDVSGPALDGLLPMGEPRALDTLMRSFAAGHRRDDVLRGMARVQGGQAVDYLARAYRLAKDDERLRLFALRELAGRGQPALPVLREGLDDPDPDVRLVALRGVLAMEAGPERLPQLKKALADHDLEVRRLALSALGNTEGTEAARAMCAALADRELSDLALGLLVERREPGLASELASQVPGIKDTAFKARVAAAAFDRGLPTADIIGFMDDPAPGVRYETARALSGRPGADAAYALLVLGGEPGFSEVSARGLSGRGKEEMKAALSEMFTKGRATANTLGFAAGFLKDEDLLAFIVDNVSAQDTALLRAALGPVMDGLRPYGLPAALKGMKSEDAKTREEIALAIAGLDTAEAAAAVREIYKGRPELRGMLFDKAVKDGREMELIPLAIKDPDESIRTRAAELALQRGYGEGIRIAASDTSANIRKTAVLGLARDSGKDAPALLGKLALDKDEGVASAALAALLGIDGGPPPGVWAEIAASRAARQPARLAAVKAISKRDEAAYAPVLAGALGDGDPDVRSAARDGLLAIGKGGLGVLNGLAGDERVGLAVLGLLIEIDDPSSEAPIIAALPKMDTRRKLLAVEALGRLGGPASLDPLAELYKDGPEELRKPVLKALGGLRLKGYEPALVETLESGLSSTDEETAVQAARDAAGLKVTSLTARLSGGPPAGSTDALRDAYRESFEALKAEHGMLVYRLEIEFKKAMAAKSADAFPILLALYKDYDEEVRARAVEALVDFTPERADPLLVKAAGESSARVRRAAGEMILARPGPGMLDGLEKVAVSDPVLGMRAVSEIRKIQGPRAEEALKEVFTKGGPEERLAAFLELGKRDPGPMPEVVAAALAKGDSALFAASVDILSGRKGADAVYGLLAIGGGDDPGLRAKAEAGLVSRTPDELKGGITQLFDKGRAAPGPVGLAAGLGPGGETAVMMARRIRPEETALMRAALGPSIARRAPYDLPAIVEGFKADDLSLKEDLAAALAGIAAPEAAQAMKDIYAGHKEVRARLLLAAGDNNRAAGLLPLGCKDPDESVRALAVGLAVKARDGDCLRGAAADPSKGIRRTAAEGLGNVPGEASAEILAGLVLSGDGDVSTAALSSLSALGENVPSGSWAALAEKGRGEVRLTALRALAGRKDARYLAVLSGALGDEDQEARKAAEEGLLADGKGALPVLHPLLRDTKLRPAVLGLIGQIADPSSEGPILAVFPGLDADTKLVAVGILGKLGGPDSLAVLAVYYREGSPEVKAAVLRAVEGLRLKGDEKDLAALLDDALTNGSDNAKFRAAGIAGRLRVARLAERLERGPGPGASALLEEQYRKSLLLIKGQGSGTGPTSP